MEDERPQRCQRASWELTEVADTPYTAAALHLTDKKSRDLKKMAAMHQLCDTTRDAAMTDIGQVCMEWSRHRPARGQTGRSLKPSNRFGETIVGYIICWKETQVRTSTLRQLMWPTLQTTYLDNLLPSFKPVQRLSNLDNLKQYQLAHYSSIRPILIFLKGEWVGHLDLYYEGGWFVRPLNKEQFLK